MTEKRGSAPELLFSRRAALSTLVAGAVAVTGCSREADPAPRPAPSGDGDPSTPVPTPSASPSPTRRTTRAEVELPRGGRTVFPRHRLVGYAGLTGAATLGRLGTGPLDERVAELEQRALRYAAGREVLPVLEVITTIVQGSPGADGRYRTRIGDDRIATYLAAARRGRALLLLNLQPGRSDFLTEARAYRRWLHEPDVGLALDPEWAMGPGQLPGRVFGHTTGAEIDRVAAYLADLVAEHDLPEKVLVYHQLTPRIVRQPSRLRPHSGVALVKSVDGIGSRASKEATYRRVWRGTPDFVRPGFKLFFDEDRRGGALMTPAQVLALRPRPDYVMFE